MFTKKLEDQFSADLLNTVNGILDEAKHDKECECEKCEEEDEDEEEDEAEEENGKKKMKEGYVSAAQRKAIWANYADGGKGHPDNKKKKKMKKEGYVPTADEPTEHDKKTAQKVRDMMAKEKKPVKEAAERQISRDEFHKAGGHQNRMQHTTGDEKNKKYWTRTPVREEAEQIDELSKDALASYTVNAARDLPRLAGKRQAEIRKTGIGASDRKIKNRIKGIDTAADRLRNEEAEQIDELSKATMGRYINKAATKMGSQGVTAGLKIAADEKSSKNFKDMGKREKGIKLAVNKLTKEEQDFIDALNDTDVEQIDELSGATLGSYVAKSRKDEADRREKGIKTRDEIRKQTGLRVGTPIDRKIHSSTTGRPAGQKMAVKKLTGQARVNAKEEFELEEGRGRPPKEGSAAWHAKQKQASDDMVSLGMQLRKAKSINKKVRFMDNKEHDIHPNHINRFEDHMAARRTTQEKDKFQRQAHKSHADFVKAVSAPVPKAAKDTGEIVKYRH